MTRNQVIVDASGGGLVAVLGINNKGTKIIIMPLNKNIDNLIAITEKEHNKYMELVEANMDKELTKIRDNNG